MTSELDTSFLPLRDACDAGWFMDATNELVKGLPVTRDDVVVDVGCGDIPNAAFCARRGAAIILADNDADKIAAAKQRLANEGARSVEAFVTDSNPLPIPDNTASIVIATEVLEHVDDPKRFLGELTRIGRPGARYLLTVPDPVAEKLQKTLAPASYFEKPNHIRIIEREEFAAMVNDAGLVVERRSSYGFYWAMWWLMFWTCKVDFPNPHHPVLDNWTRTWAQLLETEQGRQVKDALDAFMPKSQLIVARKL
jgi:SAM-dependent methyltransferase